MEALAKEKNPTEKRLGFFQYIKRDILLTGVGDLSSHFVSEVLFLLLDALALHIVNSVNKGDLAAQLLAGVSDVTSHIALEQVGTDEVLLQQADILEEGSDQIGRASCRERV